VPVQVGVVNEQLFLVNASLGLFPEILKDREAYTARFGRHRLVVLFASAQTVTPQVLRWGTASSASAAGRARWNMSL
jgi:diacylglycerol kinase family enzyme